MSKDKKFQHKLLFDPDLGQCPHTGIWKLVFIEGHVMFCVLFQMLYTSQPTTGLKVGNTSPDFRYQQETVRLHFCSPSENRNTMHSTTVTTEKEKAKENQKRNESKLCMKKFSVINLMSKEEIAFSKFNSLLLLLESLGLEDIKNFSPRSPFVVRNMAIELSEVIKSNLIKKIEKSDAFAALTDEATDL